MKTKVKLWCHCDCLRRIIVLIFLCIMGFCGIFAYDIPGSLQKKLRQIYSLSEFQYSLLYSFYSWPSVVICFFGGFCIDKMGVRIATITFAIIQLAGVYIFALGGFVSKLWVMLLGRFVFGMGGEMSAVCVNVYVLIWFKQEELNTVYAIIQNTLRFGTSAVYLMSSFILESLTKNQDGKEALSFTILILNSVILVPLIFAIVLFFLKPNVHGFSKDIDKIEAKNNDIKIYDIKNLSLTFWILCISVNLFYHTLYTFLAFTQDFFTSKYKMSISSANQVSSLFNIVPIVLATLLGLIVDRIGRNFLFMFAAIIVGIMAHVFASTACSPYLIIVTFSISNSLMMSAYLPTIAYTTDESHQGTAYGINQSIFNLISSCGAMIAGALINDYSFLTGEIYYIVCLAVVLAAFILLWILDKEKSLNKSCTKRQELKINDE